MLSVMGLCSLNMLYTSAKTNQSNIRIFVRLRVRSLIRQSWRVLHLLIVAQTTLHSRSPVDRTCGNTSSERKTMLSVFCALLSTSTMVGQRPILLLI